MSERRESVRIDISGNYRSELAGLASGLALVNREADRLNGQTIRIRTSSEGDIRRLTGDLRGADRQMQSTGRSADRMGSQIDSVSGRVGLLGEALLTLGPAAVPISAVVVPAITGLTSQLGFAVLAAGTAAIAFHGVGDALTALDAASLDPSTANLEKLRAAMEAVGPQGADLVNTIHGLGDEWDRLQSASQAGLPGVDSAIQTLTKLTPNMVGILRHTSLALGDIAQDGAASLASDRWAGFFDYLKTEARPTLTGLADAGGNLAHALAEVLQATQPLNSDFTGWLVDATGDLDRFATNLDKTQGFQDFIAYVRSEGPQVGATLGAIANAALQIVQAAAPIGGPVLAALEAFANAVAAIAGSSIGTPLFGMAAGLLAVNRAMTITKSLTEGGLFAKLTPTLSAAARGLSGVRSAQQGVTAATEASVAAQSALVAGQERLTAAARTVVRAQQDVALATERASLAEAAYAKTMQAGVLTAQESVAAQEKLLRARRAVEDSQARLVTAQRGASTAGSAVIGSGGLVAAANEAREAERQAARASTTMGRLSGAFSKVGPGAARGAAGMAAFAIATSDTGDSMEGSIASMAAMGFMIGGPWGAGIGAAVGAVTGFMKANDEAVDATERFEDTLKGADFSGFTAQLVAQRKALQDREAELPKNEDRPWYLKSISTASVDDFFNHTTEKLRTVTAEGESASLALTSFAHALGAQNELGAYGDMMGQVSVSAGDLQRSISTAEPVLQQFGVSIEDLGDMDPGNLDDLAGVVKDYLAYVDSGKGRTDAFVDSLTGLDSQFLSTADSASAMSSAMDALITPTLDAEAAADKYHSTLDGLKKATNDKAGFTGFAKGAIANREATRQFVTDAQAMLVAQAKNGASQAKIARGVAAARQDFIREGIAAGFSRKEIVKRANAMGLTPKLVRTVFQAAGAAQAEALVRRYRALMLKLPKSVRTIIKADGVPKTKGDLDALEKKAGGLTKRERRIIVKLQGNEDAQAKLKKTQEAADRTDKKKPNVVVKADTAGATSALSAFQGRVNALTGKTVTITTNHVNTGAAQADGGFYPRGVSSFAGGGFLPSQARIQPGRGTGLVQWAEAETGGEAFIPLSPSKRDRSTGILDQVATDFGYRLERMARGGTRGKGNPIAKADKRFDLSGTADIRSELQEFAEAVKKAGRHLGKRFEELGKQAVGLGKTYTDQSKRLDDLKSKAADIRGGAAGSFNHDAFSGTFADFNTQVSADRNDAAAETKALAKAAKQGLSGPLAAALAQSGNLALTQEFASKSRAQIAAAERLYGSRTTQQNALGQKAVDISGLTNQMAAQVAAMDRTSKALEKNERLIEGAVERGAEKGTRKGNDDSKRNQTRKGNTRAATATR